MTRLRVASTDKSSGLANCYSRLSVLTLYLYVYIYSQYTTILIDFISNLQQGWRIVLLTRNMGCAKHKSNSGTDLAVCLFERFKASRSRSLSHIFKKLKLLGLAQKNAFLAVSGLEFTLRHPKFVLICIPRGPFQPVLAQVWRQT